MTSTFGPPPVDPRTGKPPIFCIDADCPSCGWPERNFNSMTCEFGCPKCDYVSKERDA